MALPLSVVIATYKREKVLLSTIEQLLRQEESAWEIIVVDQTRHHEKETEEKLNQWSEDGKIKWHRSNYPSAPAALNIGLREAKQPYVLFIDDDIKIEANFLKAHINNQDQDVFAVNNRELAKLCLEMLAQDVDGLCFLHYLGEGFRIAVSHQYHNQLTQPLAH